MQLNNAKFEFNGNTGYILKPWVLRSERAQFSPFVIKKLEDIVPAKISIKVRKGRESAIKFDCLVKNFQLTVNHIIVLYCILSVLFCSTFSRTTK